MRNKIQTILLFLCCLPFMAQADETVTYLHHDVLGSVIGTSDNAGKLQKTEYLSYGTKNGAASSETSELGYTGKPHFKDLGLSYYGSRWYDPDAGRFTGIDPVAWTKQYAVHSFNRYSYANNNPYKYVDPDGEFIFTAIAIAAVAYAAYDGYQSGGTSGALAEASGYNDAVASYNDIKDGNYGGAVLAAGSIVFKPLKGAQAVAKKAEAARDALANEKKRKHATYAGGHKDGKTVGGCSSNPSGCAEDDIARQLGSDAQMTGAKGFRRNKATGELEYKDIPVCTNCQSKYNKSQFPSDVKYDAGGAWSK